MFQRARTARMVMAVAIIVALVTGLVACRKREATPEPEMITSPAPIDSVEVLIAESFPPQYFLVVKSGLPNACARFDRYEVTREGYTIQVTVTNLEPVGQECEDTYTTVDHNIPLGSDFEPGKTFTVVVNDVTDTFVTQGAPPDATQVPAILDSPFQLKVGQTALVSPQGPIIEFVEVAEDSRCPVGATCVQAGRARVLVRVSSEGDVLGFGIQELTLEAGQLDPAEGSAKGVHDTFLFVLAALDPYPKVKGEGEQEEEPDYTATFIITKLEATPTPAATTAPTGTPAATTAPTSTPPCAVRKDWTEHTVVKGETLYGIAQRTGSTVKELAKANCLADPRLIFAGQTLYVPKKLSADDSPPTEYVKVYLIIPGDDGQSGPAVGCGDSAIAVLRDRPRTGSLRGDIQASLQELFSIKTPDYGQSGYVHSLHDADVLVESVTVNGDVATISLNGTLQLLGVCADARMEAQILFTVFQYPGVNSALITLNGRNLKQVFDMSGLVGGDEPYLRSEVQF